VQPNVKVRGGPIRRREHNLVVTQRLQAPGLRLVAFALGASVLVLAGCESPASTPGTGVPTQCQQEAPIIQGVKTDILFVVDNSGSMAANQQRVATDLPVFVAELQKSGGVANSYRVGLTSTSPTSTSTPSLTSTTRKRAGS